MARQIKPIHDLIALIRLLRALRRIRPQVVNYGTPKAGLLGAVASWTLRVPRRIYTLHGLRYETTSGIRRRFLILVERLIAHLSTQVMCVSPSLRQVALEDKVAGNRALVLGAGSCNGVDAEEFSPTNHLRRSQATRMRIAFNISGPVVGFVGRLVPDKGISELAEAFATVKSAIPNAQLLLVGAEEAADPLHSSVRISLRRDPSVIFVGHVQDTAPFYHLMDVLVLPSYREGLPTVVLEAMASGVPVVGTRATGIRDVVQDGVTGWLCDVGDAQGLAEGIIDALTHIPERCERGAHARQWILEHFNQRRVWSNIESLLCGTPHRSWK